MRLRVTWWVAAALLVSQTVAAAPFGSIHGRVTDANTLEPLVGARVVVTSPSLPGERSARSFDDGWYALSGLPPGVYHARFVFTGVTTERSNIRVRAGRQVRVDAGINSATVQIARDPPLSLLDDATGVGTHVDAMTLAHRPVRTRDVAASFDLVPTWFAIGAGSMVTVAGLNVTDPAFRTLATRLPLEFVDELDLCEGGWRAERGRSSGGWLSIATKSGGSRLTGSVFSTLRPGSFAGDPSHPSATGTWLAEREQPLTYSSTGVELGGALLPDRFWFHVGYAPEILSTRWTRRIRRGFAGDDVSDASDSDSDGVFAEPNGNPDGLRIDAWGRPVTRPAGDDTELTSLAVAHRFHTKLTHRLSDHSRHSLTLFGAPTEFDGVVENPFDPRSPHASLNGDTDSFRFRGFTGNLSGVYSYIGSYFEDRLDLELLAGWHHQERRYHLAQKTHAPLVVYVQPRALDAVEPGVSTACAADVFDDGTGSCMVAGYAAGGFGGGILASELLNRWSERATVRHHSARHELAAGIDFEQTTYRSQRRVPGGGTYRYDRDTAQFAGARLFRDEEPRDRASARTASLDWAAFVQDRWTPATDLTVDVGLRWQGQQLFAPTLGDRTRLGQVFAIHNGIAPRLGAAWDFLGDRRSRLFVHWGRYLLPVPLGVIDRTFGGVGLRPASYDSSTCVNASGGPAAAGNVTDPARQCVAVSSATRARRGVAAPGLDGERTDELLGGVEVEPWPTWTFAVTGVWRTLGEALTAVETTHGGVLANPGRLDPAALATTIAASDAAATAALREGASTIDELPRPERDQWGVRVAIDKRFAGDFAVRASYFLSWSRGNTLGVLDAGGVTLESGPLAGDRRHRVKLDGFWVLDLQGRGIPWVSTLGGSARIASGAPIDVLAVDASTGAVTHLLPRGAGGRTPWLWSVDVHVASRYQLDARLALELFVELFNVFHRREAIAAVSTYTWDTVEPIPGGTTADLEHTRNADGEPVHRNPEYGEPLVFQPPFAASIGLRLLF